MKNKKIINIVIVCVVLIGAILLLLSLINNKGNITKKSNQITDLKETKIGALEDLAIVIDGDYTGIVINEDIEKMKAYEFDATYDNGWTVEKNHYIGIRLKDAFEYLSITDYEKVVFTSKGLVRVTYEKSDITDDTYLIIKRDGDFIDGRIFNVISFDKDYNYSLYDLRSINVDKEG